MRRHMKRLLSLVLTVVLVSSLSGSVLANDTTVLERDNIAEVQVKNVYQEIFQENGFEPKAISQFSYVHMENDTTPILCMNTYEDNRVRSDLLIFFSEDNLGNNVIVDPLSALSGSLSTKEIELLQQDMERAGTPYTYNGYSTIYTVTATAVYNTVSISSIYTGYQPTGVYFTYKKVDSNASISSIKVDYITGGSVYTYPGNVSTGNVTSWTITVSKSSPSPNTVYSKTRSYGTASSILLNGGPNPGMYLTFTIERNGKTDRSSVCIKS